jgi:hypothetical protein
MARHKKSIARGGPLSPEEKKWSLEAIKKLDGKITLKRVTEAGFLEEHNKKFDRKLNAASSLYTRFKILSGGGHYSSKKKPEYIFENSSYLVYIKGFGTSGFESEDEVKAFLEQSKIIGNVIVFKKVNVEIKYDIKIG